MTSVHLHLDDWKQLPDPMSHHSFESSSVETPTQPQHCQGQKATFLNVQEPLLMMMTAPAPDENLSIKTPTQKKKKKLEFWKNDGTRNKETKDNTSNGVLVGECCQKPEALLLLLKPA